MIFYRYSFRCFLHCFFAYSLVSVLQTSSLAADEWVIGLGADDILDKAESDEAVAVSLEYRSDPYITWVYADASFLASAQYDSFGDLYVGVGVHSYIGDPSLNSFWELSLAAGYFVQGHNPTKQGDEFQFKSSFGFTLNNAARVSLTIDHLLGKSLRNDNPGSEVILSKYAF